MLATPDNLQSALDPATPTTNNNRLSTATSDNWHPISLQGINNIRKYKADHGGWNGSKNSSAGHPPYTVQSPPLDRSLDYMSHFLQI
jgi:hypothetical protein